MYLYKHTHKYIGQTLYMGEREEGSKCSQSGSVEPVFFHYDSHQSKGLTFPKGHQDTLYVQFSV